MKAEANKRFNLWLPARLWKRFERYCAERSKELELEVKPTSEIKRALERHLDEMGAK